MKQNLFLTFLVFFVVSPVIAAEGLINVKSELSVQETTGRLEKILQDKGMTIFKSLSHSDGAKNVGIELRETQLIIFGNPKVGSPLLQCQQSVAIDLPQKMIIWKDDQSRVWVSYNDPRYLEKRHLITGCEDVLVKIEKALSGFASYAATQ